MCKRRFRCARLREVTGPCLTYSEDAIADSAARRNPVRVDVAVPADLEERSPVRADCEGKQAIPLADRCRREGTHILKSASATLPTASQL